LCLQISGAFSDEGAEVGRCRSVQATGQPETGPVPHREQNSAMGVAGAPMVFLSPDEDRLGQHWDGI